MFLETGGGERGLGGRGGGKGRGGRCVCWEGVLLVSVGGLNGEEGKMRVYHLERSRDL